MATSTDVNTPDSRKIIKALVTISLFGILLYGIGLEKVISALTRLDLQSIILAFFLVAAQIFAASLRWVLLIRRSETPISAYRAALIHMVSSLASIAFVTSVASITLRAILHHRSGTSFASVAFGTLAEKLLGLLALATICVVMVFVDKNYELILSASQNFFATIGNILTSKSVFHLLTLSFLLGLGYLFCKQVSLRAHKQISWLNEHASVVRKMGREILTPRFFIASFATSLVIILLGACAILIVAQAYSQTVPLFKFLFIFPAIALVAALPISMGGWGVREGAMVVGLGFLNVPAEQAFSISVSYGLLGTIATLIIGSAAYGLFLPHWTILSNKHPDKRKTGREILARRA